MNRPASRDAGPDTGQAAASGRPRHSGPRHSGPRHSGPQRAGRRTGESGTREAILDAARRQFAGRGYDGATIRAIAAGAGVDPALVHHFYGTKEALFAAAMRLPVVPSEVITAALKDGIRPSGVSVGEHMVRTALTMWESTGLRDSFQGLLRSAVTSDQAAAMLREFLADAILGPVASVAHGADPEGAAFRASMVATQMLGLALARYVLKVGPVACATIDELVAAIGPTVDRYMTGDLLAAGPTSVPARERKS
jgi:AcrR family transcriptional regulator